MSVKSPSVSVLVRTKNRSFSLKEALESIVAQDYRPVEVVVVNDGGEDVEPIIEDTFFESDVEWLYRSISEPGKGRSHAANVAMSLAKGDYWLFLDDDDLILPAHVSSLVNRLEKSAETVVGVYSSVQCVSKQVDSQDELKGETFAFDFDATRLVFKNYLPIHAVLFRSEVYKKGCRFDETLDLYEDWNFWVQVIQFGDFEHFNHITALYRTHLSGVGLPGTKKDFNDDLILFFKASMPFWQTKHWLYLFTQESHYFKLLSAYQDLESEKQIWSAHMTQLEEQAEETRLLLEANAKQTELLVQKQSLEFQNELSFLSKKLNEFNGSHSMTQAKLDNIENLVSHIQTDLTNRPSLKNWLDQLRADTVAKTLWLKHKLSRLLYFSREFVSLLLKCDFKILAKKIKKKLTDWFFQSKQSKCATFETPILPPMHSDSPVFILATHHTRFIALLIEHGLKQLGFVNVTILAPETKEFTSDYHFVVCPQIFEYLPSYYFAFQMEQSVSSRWFTEDYFHTLEHSVAIMDYSLKNIDFLQEEAGFPYQRLFYTPVSNLPSEMVFPNAAAVKKEAEYDVVFYGDVNSPRRKRIVEELGRRFKLLVVSEVFGEALYSELNRAKVVVNIHYYETALLETTRIYECLSLGLNVISEVGSDQSEHALLDEWVRFTPINDVEAMCSAIESVLSTSNRNDLERTDINHFTYYLGRMLMSLDLIPRDTSLLPMPLSCKQCYQRLGLSLPETYDRRLYLEQTQPKTHIFPGLRHTKGWIGCALSYHYMAKQALACGLTQLEICEDDVILGENFETQLKTVRAFLSQHLEDHNWDVFSGLIADLNEKATVANVYEYDGIQFVELNFMTSTVFNIYNHRTLKLLAEWNPYDENPKDNTIDRYLETKGLRVITTLPFLVGHHEEQNSTLWGIANDVYDSMIEKSENRLREKVGNYLASNSVVEYSDDKHGAESL